MQDREGDWWNAVFRIVFLPFLLLFTLFMTATTLLFSIGRRG